jgi:replicative DNA helicase
MPAPKKSPIKLPPQNIEAEQAVLGSLLLDKNAITKVADLLEPSDFYNPAHEKIYETILDLYEKRRPIDILTLTNRLKELNKLQEVGGAGYLAELTNQVTTPSHVDHYAKLVKEKRALRDLIKVSAEITEEAFSSTKEFEDLMDDIEHKILSISQRSLPQNFTPIREELKSAYERIERLHEHKESLRGVPTGFTGLDNLLSGLQKSDLIVLGARPSLGKTSLALDIARYAALKANVPVGLFSLEMSREQVIDRLISAESQVPLWKLRTGRIGSELEFHMIQDALDKLSRAPIFIDDSPSPNILQMRSTARRLQIEHGLGLLIVDYLQLIAPRKHSDNLVAQVTEISRGLKALARELNVPLLALSQLSRAVDQRDHKVPKLHDLRESGCLTGDTLITRADTGEMVTLRSLAERENQTPVPVFTLDENWKLKIGFITKAFSSGRKPVYELRTASGRTIRASANHPFRKLHGWSRLDQLAPGDAIALPRILKPIQILETVGCAGSRGELIPALIAALRRIASGPGNDIIPKEAWPLLLEPAKAAAGVSRREIAKRLNVSYSGSSTFQSGIGRERTAHAGTACQSRVLAAIGQSDIFWDRIVSITPCGEEETYDATVPGTHNFVANDIIVHNSIEQDADVVLFIYRKDRDKIDVPIEEQNIAQIIVAKHRNGPLGSVELRFDAERVSFRNIDKTLSDIDEPPSQEFGAF